MTPTNIESYAELIINHIITDEQKKQAKEDVENIEFSTWRSARLLVSLLDHEDIKDELPKASVIRAVADLYGLSDKTVYSREKPARLFPAELVNAHPLLTFSYWKTAADARHLDDPLESALDIVWTIEHETEIKGKRPSVRTVESWVYRDDNEKIKTVWRSRAEGIGDQLEKIIHDGYAPPDFRNFAGWLRAMLLSYLETGTSPLAMGTAQAGQPGTPPPDSNKKGGDPG